MLASNHSLIYKRDLLISVLSAMGEEKIVGVREA